MTTYDENTADADNGDETLCELKRLFQTDATKQVSRGRIYFREPIEEIIEHDNDRPLMTKLSKEVEYQSKKIKKMRMC